MSATPAPLPPTAYCASGMADVTLAEHEASLQILHERGQLRLLDRGEDAQWRRWRMRWTEGTRTIRCGLLIGKDTNVAGLEDTLLWWVYAESDKPFGLRDQQNPSWRIGLDALDAKHNIRDLLGQFSLTEYSAFFAGQAPDDLSMTASIVEGSMRTTPLVVINAERDEGPRIRSLTERFRKATRGLAGAFVVDAGVRARLNELLPPGRAIPARGARLFLPHAWLPHIDEPTIRVDRLDRPGRWRALTDTVIKVASWRFGQFAMTGPQWRSVLHEAMDDEPLHPEHEVTWLPPDSGASGELATQLHHAQQQHQALREAAGERSERIATITLQLQQHATALDRAEQSRHRLARLTSRFRQERDTFDAAQQAHALPELLAGATERETEAQLYADELDQLDDECHQLRRELHALEQQQAAPSATVDTEDAPHLRNFTTLLAHATRSFPGLVFGPRTEAATALDGHPRTASWLRRTWAILRLLDHYQTNHDRATRGLSDHVVQHGPQFGLSPTLLATRETRQVDKNPHYRAARTFPVPTDVSETGWAYFDAHFRIERGGGFTPRMHIWDDTRGVTGAVHIGYLGPHLPSPATN